MVALKSALHNNLKAAADNSPQTSVLLLRTAARQIGLPQHAATLKASRASSPGDRPTYRFATFNATYAIYVYNVAV